MAQEKNSYLSFELTNGDTVQLTLSFYRLYQLRTSDPNQYKEYFRVTEKGLKDEFDVWTQIYTAYRCANLEAEELAYPTFEDFLMVVPDGRETMWNVYFDLTGRKKKKVE